MTEQDLLNQIILIASSRCKLNEAIHVSDTLSAVFDEKLMHKIPSVFIEDNNFCACALPSFIAGAYVAIKLRDENKVLDELERLWNKT